MASVHASVASTSNPLTIMPPDFFNSLIGSPSMKDSKAIDVVDNDMINSNSNNDKSVNPMTAAALSSAVRNMLNSEFLRQKWLYSQR